MPIAAALSQSVSAVQPKLRRQVAVVGCDHAAFAGRHDLVAKKTERGGVAETADTLSLIFSPMCLCRVLEDKQAMFTRDRNDRVHVRRMAVKVYWDDALRMRGDLPSNSSRINIERPRVTVDEHRRGAAIGHGVSGGNVSKGRNDDFVAWLEAQRDQCEVQCIRSIVDGDGMFDAAKARETALELSDESANRRDPSRFEAFKDVALLVAI